MSRKFVAAALGSVVGLALLLYGLTLCLQGSVLAIVGALVIELGVAVTFSVVFASAVSLNLDQPPEAFDRQLKGMLREFRPLIGQMRLTAWILMGWWVGFVTVDLLLPFVGLVLYWGGRSTWKPELNRFWNFLYPLSVSVTSAVVASSLRTWIW